MKPFVILLSLIFIASCTSEEIIQPEIDSATLIDQQSINSTTSMSAAFPGIIPLPNGFSPEGIATGSGADFFVGSLVDGSIYKGSYRDGSGSVLVSGTAGQLSVGLDFDERTEFLFVAGGSTDSKVYNGSTGEVITTLEFDGSGFVNDVILTRDAAYFTDSFLPVFYKVELNKDGTPTNPVEYETITLNGDFGFIPGNFNGNGIVATPNGKRLIIVNGTSGELYLVDPDTGFADLIEGVSVPSGDGLVLLGKELFVVQNFLNQIAVVKLAPDYSSGQITDIYISSDFRIPTTAAEFGSSLYAVNARFDVAPPGSGASNFEFEVVKVSRK